MIAAIDSSRLANRDDRAAGAATQVQDQKFNAILNTASRREPSAALAKLERPVSPQEAQPRSIYGDAAPVRPQVTKPEDRDAPREAAATRREQGTGVSAKLAERMANADEGKAPEPEGAPEDAAAQQDKATALRDADELPPSADQIAGAVALTGTVLTFKDIIAQSNARSLSQRSVSVQLGAAAYRMSPHGEGEAALARQMGAAPAPDVSQALDPGAALDGRNAVRKASDLDVPSFKSDPVLVVDALAMVELSKQAQAARTAEAESGAAPAGSALSRDQFLSQIGAPTGNTAQLAAQQAAQAVQTVAPELKDAAADLAAAKDAPVKAVDTAVPVQASGIPSAFAAQSTDRPESLGTDKTPGESRMLDKVVQEARWMIRGNKQEVTMRLEPDHLGSLKLHVTQKDGNLHIEMTVDNAAAKHMLDSNMSQLRERFAQENLAQGSTLQVDVRHGGNSEFAQQSVRQGAEGGGSAAGIRHAAAVEEAKAAAPRAAWSNSNVSIYA